MDSQPIPILIPEPSDEISFGDFIEDLKRAYAGEVAALGSAGDPWRVMGRRALKLAPITLPEEAD